MRKSKFSDVFEFRTLDTWIYPRKLYNRPSDLRETRPLGRGAEFELAKPTEQFSVRLYHKGTCLPCLQIIKVKNHPGHRFRK